MARLEVQIDGNANGLTSSLNKANAGLNRFSNEAAKVTAQTNKFSGSVGQANGVAIEFNRIIQDAPYGMMGIGNNITQLTQSFSTLKQQTGSTGAALKQTFTSILSSGNLLSLGISAIVTGWTLWERHAQKANKATKDLEDGTKSYIETLEGLKRASGEGQVNAQKDLTNLKLMYEATQNLTIPMKDRKRVADELIKQYPKQFEGLTTEAVLAGKASQAYDKLTASITATAMAAAYANKMTENAQKQLNNYLQIIDKQNQANKLSLAIEREKASISTSAAGSAGVGASSAAQYRTIAAIEEKRTVILNDINKLGKENSDITNENNLLQKNYNDQIVKGADAGGKLSTQLDKVGKTTKEGKDIMQDLVGSVMSEYDRKIFDINNKYDEIFKKIKLIGNASKQADAFGLATQAKQFETLQAQVNRYIETVKGISPSGLRTLTNSNINSSSLPGLSDATDRINKPTKSVLSKDDKDLEKRLGRVVERGFRSGLDNILSSMDDLGNNFKEVFSNAFSTISGSFSKVFQDMIVTQLGDGFAKKINSDDFELWKGLGSKLSKAFVAGASMAGGLISNLTNKTSYVGQGIGAGLSGAASGAAAGAAIGGQTGSIWGAVAGGLIGAISGIFGASSARKQEKIQQEQLLEQKKQTALMERQNPLAWASNISGMMTVNGIVNGVERNAKGQLVAKVSGQDLMFILNRTGGERW